MLLKISVKAKPKSYWKSKVLFWVNPVNNELERNFHAVED
jgi:hypothetical protein